LRRELLVIKEDLGINAHIIRIRKAGVAFGDAVVLIRFGGVLTTRPNREDHLSAVKAASGGKAIVENLEPGLHTLARGDINQGSNALGSELEEIIEFEQGEAANTHAGLIHEGIGILLMPFEGGLKRRNAYLVEADE